MHARTQGAEERTVNRHKSQGREKLQGRFRGWMPRANAEPVFLGLWVLSLCFSNKPKIYIFYVKLTNFQNDKGHLISFSQNTMLAKENRYTNWPMVFSWGSLAVLVSLDQCQVSAGLVPFRGFEERVYFLFQPPVATCFPWLMDTCSPKHITPVLPLPSYGLLC